MDERVERMVKHFAVEVDATPEQKEKLTTIAKGAARDLVPMAGKIKQARQLAIDLMGAETVDRAAIENLRAGQRVSGRVGDRARQPRAAAAPAAQPGGECAAPRQTTGRRIGASGGWAGRAARERPGPGHRGGDARIEKSGPGGLTVLVVL